MRPTLLLSLVLAACERTPARPAATAAPALAAAPARLVEPECTLDTPLVPGVPGSPGHLLPSDRNPNGVSELAALMRTMQAELTALRPRALEGGAIPAMTPRFRKMRCSWPTTPSDRNAQFDAMARAYLEAVGALEQAAPAERAAAFDRVVEGCRSCHAVTCSGVLPAIDALRLAPVSTP